MLLHPPAKLELECLGVLEQAEACGASVKGICATTIRGQPLFQLGYQDLAPEQFGLGIQRGTLHYLLSTADTNRGAVMAGRNMANVDPRGGYLTEDTEARHGPYDLIVIADGAESRIRNKLPFTTIRSRAATTAALVGLIDGREDFAPDRLEQRFDRGAHVSVWPVGRHLPGDTRKLAFAMNTKSCGAHAFRDGGLWKDFLSATFPELVPALGAKGAGSRPYVFTYRDVEVDSYSCGRVVLIGDAAHSMSPQLGVGAQLAMADARILAGSLLTNESVAGALHDYSRVRQAQVRRYQHASRWLTPIFQSDSRLMARLRDGVLAGAMRLPLAKRIAQELLC